MSDAFNTGMEFRDLLTDPAFLRRTGKKRDFQQPLDALRRVTEVFASHPENVLQELVNVAMSCCGADSAGISLMEDDEEGKPTFRWVAVAGSFSHSMYKAVPRAFSVPVEAVSIAEGHIFTASASLTTTS